MLEPDEQLFERVRQGDMAAFDALYIRYETRLFGYLRALLPDRRDAEECLHDAFMGALKFEGTFEPDGFRALLYRIARNSAHNRRRLTKRGAARDTRAATEGLAPIATVLTADALLETRELERALTAAVSRLSTPLGELYHLRTSGLSYEQIADVVEVPVGTVKSRMHQMVQLLREELKSWTAAK